MQILERHPEPGALRRGAHDPGEHLAAGWQEGQGGEFRRAVIKDIPDLHGVAAAGYPQHDVVGPPGQVGHHPAGPAEGQHGAQPRPALEKLHPRLQPGALVGAEHDARLVVLNAEGAAHPYRHVKVPGENFAVDVTAVPDVPVTCLTPEICAGIDTHRDQIARPLPVGGLVKPLHGALHGVSVSTVSVSGGVVSATWTRSSELRRNGANCLPRMSTKYSGKRAPRRRGPASTPIPVPRASTGAARAAPNCSAQGRSSSRTVAGRASTSPAAKMPWC